MKRLIMVLVVLAMVAGCASQQKPIRTVRQYEIDKVNAEIAKYMPEMNNICRKYYGVDCINNMYITRTAMVLDYKNQAFNYSTLSIDKQLEMTIDAVRSGMFSQADAAKLRRLGFRYIRILIDGRFYKEYNL